MSRWRFALSRRWAGYLALTVAFAIVCSLLGMWQFARRADARAEIDRIDANYDSQPIPVAEALPTLDAFTASQKWMPVRLNGTYLRSEELLVRNRPFAGRPGFEVLTPLLLDSGEVFIVDRGWVPTGSKQDAPDGVPPASSGRVSVVVRLKAGEPTLAGRSTAAGSRQIPTINLPAVAETLRRPTYTGAYGLVASETPTPASAPASSLRPVRDEGPHLSYALQWFVFALIAFAGLGWALRQEYRLVNAADPDELDRAAERARRKAGRRPTDSETEDAILDSR